ncbi:hypothetical protein DFH06DRAFT_1321120 [Mycena polygramma]|nr:hypothetical protein DFH06DRAFT_1321120 [Mycena polygramma]
MDAILEPALPSELEHLIFETAALLRPRSIPKLMLVAWRVKIWVEPLMYRTIILSDSDDELYNLEKLIDENAYPLAIKSSTFLFLLQTKPPSFFKNSIRQLHISDTHLNATQEAEVQSACSDVNNLWLADQLHTTLTTINMPLERVHCALYALFGTGAIDFTHRMFASITHLELFDVPERIDVEAWSALSDLPHLTHFAFNDDRINAKDNRVVLLMDDYLPMCLTLLQTWTSLRILVLLYSRSLRTRTELEKAPRLVEDCRVVVMPCDEFLVDWIMGAYAGSDYWSRAEQFVAKRKSGEIDALEYFLESV